MKFKGWIIAGPSRVELKEFDTEVGGGLVATDSPEFETAERTPLRDDQVILRTAKASICDTDAWLYPMGGDVRRPRGCQFGHEMVSTIVAKGKGVIDFEVGDRVYPFPRFVKEAPGYVGRPGAYSELVVCDHARKGYNLYPVDDAISDVSAALIEPFTNGFHAAAAVDPKPGETAVVIGSGCSGLAAAVALRERGVEDVVVLGKFDRRLECARRLDAKMPFETVALADEDWVEQLEARFGTSRTQFGPAIDVDMWIDATPSAEIFETVFGRAKNFARITTIATHHKPAEIDLTKLAFTSVMMCGSGGYLSEDVEPVMNAMKSGRYDVEGMVDATYAFSEFDMAMEYCQFDAECLKCQIDFEM